MMRRWLRVLWPLALVMLVFATRTVACKRTNDSARAKKKWPTELTVRFTLPPPLPSITNPPGANVRGIPKLGE
jgi:hypothetical protein